MAIYNGELVVITRACAARKAGLLQKNFGKQCSRADCLWEQPGKDDEQKRKSGARSSNALRREQMSGCFQRWAWHGMQG